MHFKRFSTTVYKELVGFEEPQKMYHGIPSNRIKKSSFHKRIFFTTVILI